MKKVKFSVASVLFCAMVYTGYTVHEKMNVSEAEKFMQTNIEALTSGETGGATSWLCWSEQKSGSGYWRCDHPECKWIDGAGGKGNTSMCYAKK